MSTAEWLIQFGAFVPGGGPATTARNGAPLTSLAPDDASPESSLLAADGSVQPWNWQASGVVEMDCFVCHLTQPDASARAKTITAGNFAWANTASLSATGIVTPTADGFAWQSEAFGEDGKLLPAFVQIQDPTNENCAACHGVVHTDAKQPLVFGACDLSQPQTATTGQVVSPQLVSQSGINLAGKATLDRPWDVHAERALKCTDCHYALNNPVHAQEAAGSQPNHLVYDPRRLELGEYLQRPNHDLARGASAQFTIDEAQKGSMRRCESCHAAEETHNDWLPYSERHMEVLACESCHIPTLYAPAIEAVDWTVLQADGTPVTQCRGVEGGSGGSADTVDGLVTGYEPVLMQRTNVDGDTMLAPYNLISAWYWVFDDANGAPAPVRQQDLEAVYLDQGFESGGYAPEIVTGFDANGDGQVETAELVIDSDAKQSLISQRLRALGLANPRIEAQTRPYSINHSVTRDEWVTKDCQACHANNSRVAAGLSISSRTPGEVLPTFVADNNVTASGAFESANGVLRYQPALRADGIYIFGHNRVAWIDLFGALFFAGTLLAVTVHGTLRFVAAMRRPRHAHKLKRVYMYRAYERFWHWLQTITIIILLFTGLIIHRPDIFGIFSFPHVVMVHNVLAAVLVINAALSLFWHLAGGEIRQYIPRPYGFFDQAIEQTKYYVSGIFKDDPHPFEKSRERHLNPLQQVTYFGILNVLLPLQVITGALMWGVQRWPQFAGALGGLPFLAPFHTLVAWTFASFIVGHVYLTTTGERPLSGIQAMVTGWEEVPVDGVVAGSAHAPTTAPAAAD
jgi:thiosulfate reductase cytochrome b subunit